MPEECRWPARVGGAAAGLALIIFGGLVHGNWIGRWGLSRELEDAVAALRRVPSVIGEWEGQSLELDPRQVAVGEIEGYISRRYESRRGHGAIHVLLVCGRPGPISLHPPDVCYQGAGFEPDSTPVARVVAFGPGVAALKQATFRKSSSLVPQTLLISWAWSDAGVWEAPDQPRVKFALSPALYKLYVIREIASVESADDEAVYDAFLREFLSKLDEALFSGRGRTDLAAQHLGGVTPVEEGSGLP